MIEMDRPRRVLVIDDQAGIREVFCDFLGLLGHQGDAAANGEEGLRVLDARAYDLVITDFLMPGMTGLEFAHALRQRNPEIAVIMISGSMNLAESDRIQQVGLHFLQKPVTFESFTAVVDRALDGPRRG